MLSETLDSEGLFHCDLGSFRKTNWRAPSTAFAMGPTGAGLTYFFLLGIYDSRRTNLVPPDHGDGHI